MDFLRRRLRQAVTADPFGRLPAVLRMIGVVVWILAFWCGWKLLDSAFTLHWLLSAFLAIVAACFLLRILGRLFRNDSE